MMVMKRSGLLALALLAAACGQGAEEAKSEVTSSAPAGDGIQVTTGHFTGSFDSQSGALTVSPVASLGGARLPEDTIPTGTGANQVNMHTVGTPTWVSPTLSGSVEAINGYSEPVTALTAVIDTITVSGVTSNAPWSYGTVAGGATSSAQTWAFNDPSGANFGFSGHTTGNAPVFGATCPTGTTYSEPWASNPISTSRWTNLAGTETWTAGNEALAVGSPNTQMWIGTRPSWTNYTVTVPIRIDSGGGNGGLSFRVQSAGSGNDSGSMYYAGFDTGHVYLGKENNNYAPLSNAAGSFSTGTFHTMTLTVSGSTFTLKVDSTSTVATDTSFANGSIGLRTYSIGMSYGPMTVTCN